ncbi:hypothetical protein [Streptomyces sp. NBC_00455]|uniref:hypothetical protein n=1 Tax=Streptomyces sp. NBC_00455 TaxID=2903654 RepID=UPI002E241C4E
MLHSSVLVELPPVDVLPPELEPELADECDPPLLDALPDEARGGCAHDSPDSTTLNASSVVVLYVPAEGVWVHTFQLEVCTTERLNSLASAYATDLTWCPWASATAF